MQATLTTPQGNELRIDIIGNGDAQAELLGKWLMLNVARWASQVIGPGGLRFSLEIS